MKNVALALLAVLLSRCAALPTSQTQAISPLPELTYIFEPVLLDNRRCALNVELIFKGGPGGTTTLRIPHSWGGHHNLEQNISSPKALSPHTRVLQQNNKTVVIHPANSRVRLSYQIIPQKRETLHQNRNYYKPILQNDYLHLIGETFLIHPDRDTENEITVTLVWKNLPESWSLIHSYGAHKRKTHTKTTLTHLKNSLFVAGNVQIIRQDVLGNPLYFVLSGSWNFPADQFMQTTGRVLETQRNFWNDHDFDFFLVSLSHIGAACCHAGGLNLHHAVSLFLPDDQKLTAELKHLVAHELFHTWNGQKIQRAYPQEKLFWFSEGFTNYFARLINLKSGVISPAEYVDGLNRVIFEYYSPPADNSQNLALRNEFWKNNEAAKNPYVKGEILARYWNELIKKSNPDRSLGSLMKYLFKHARETGTKVSERLLDEIIHKFVAHQTIAGVNMPIPLADDPGSCIRLTHKIFETDNTSQTKHWAVPSTYQPNLGGKTTIKIPQYELIPDCATAGKEVVL